MARDLSAKSKITAKYQVTIPRNVRERLKLQVADAIEWSEAEDGRIYVAAAAAPILQLKGAITVGRGDIRRDVRAARTAIADKHR